MTNFKAFSLLTMTVIGMTIASSGANAQMWGPPRIIPQFGQPIFRGPPPVFVPIYDPYAAERQELARRQAEIELMLQQRIVCSYAPCGYSDTSDDHGLVRKTIRRTEEVESIYHTR